MSHPEPVFGSLTICHRNNIYKLFFHKHKTIALKNVHGNICYVKKYISCFFLLKIVSGPKTDHDSKTDFPFYNDPK